jgi:hypothetical protein
MFVRGDRTVNHIGSGVTTLRPKGPIKQKTITYNITGAITTDSFQVIANPYPGQVHLARIYKEDNNFNKIRNGFWIWDPHLNSDSGGYRTLSWTGVDDNYTITPCPGCDQATKNLYAILNSAQAVIVKQRGSGGSLVVKENYKTSRTDNPQLFRFSNNAMGTLQVNVYKNTARGTELVDGTLCRFSDFYGNAQAEEYDASKLENFGENISFVSNRNQKLSVHSRVYPKRDDTLHLAFWKASQRAYKMKIATENMSAVNLQAYLLDAFTGSETPIPLNGSDVTYDFQVTNDLMSQSLTRFKIVFQPGNAPEVQFTKLKAEAVGEGNLVTWEVASEVAISSYELERSNNGSEFKLLVQKESGNQASFARYEWTDGQPFATRNYYRIKALDASGNYRYSNTVLVDRTTQKPEVRVYPTTVTNKTITVNVTASESGNWGLTLTNTLGQVVFARNLVHGGGQSTQAVDLSKAQLVPGIYILNIRKGQELLHTTKIIVQ